LSPLSRPTNATGNFTKSRPPSFSKEPTMMTNHPRQLLRHLALSAAVLLTVAPIALADPPGYDFQSFDQSLPTPVSPRAPQKPAAATNQSLPQSSAASSATAPAGTPLSNSRIGTHPFLEGSGR
jgi:hypothetical protein